ncbi:MAG: isoleucine--tRNA ligase [Opitutales bacterium]
MSDKLKDTLNLPQTDFPMRGNLVEREPKRIEHWAQTGVYQRITEKNKADGGELFVLHDGPPFTNGDVHIGTALNKTLKDTILRYKRMRGYVCPYIPGWDSHGLPIEHKVMTQLKDAGKDLEALQIRKECEAFANNFIEIQRGQFQRLGILADWKEEYRTIDPDYEAEELIGLAKVVEKDLLYRSKKPVYWSIPCKTALAEAEIEYKEKKSPSIYVKFAVENPEAIGESGPLNVVIWTTTPWTLPANLAVAAGPEIEYVIVSHGGEKFILAKELAESVAETCEMEGAVIGENVYKGSEFDKLTYKHPFIDRSSPVVLADYVTIDSGTGLVHTAPGHGLDDYQTGLKYGLEIYCPLDDNACYIDDGQIPAELVGLSTLEIKGRAAANKGVLQIIEGNGSLLSLKPYTHSYPHCWRSKTPVIFRAMDQWFIALDKDGSRDEALKALEAVSFIPDWGRNRITGAVETRPDWCISRQRSWGVPIPAFYDANGQAYMEASVVHGVAEKVRQHGSNIWFEWSAEQILEGVELPADWPQASALTLGRDTLDVWIDSASSQNAVLAKHPDLARPADLYLEGSDQHRGWFQSSLWIGSFTHGNAPYKELVTHGYIVKEDGTKISKSDGTKSKPQTSDSYIKQFGADVVRLWICSQDFRGDIPVSEKLIKNVGNTYRTLRNTFRFLHGNLYDFDAEQNSVSVDALTDLDKWALHQMGELIEQVQAYYDAYEFHRAYQLIANFVSITLSATYHDILKDRLYTWAPDAPERRSSQTALYHIFKSLTALLSPMLPFTTDEAWSYFTASSELGDTPLSSDDWPQVTDFFKHPEASESVSNLLKFKTDHVNEVLESLRQEKKIGQSLDARVDINISETHALSSLLQSTDNEQLTELLNVSGVSVTATSESEASIQVTAAPAADSGWVRCPRSWRWVPELTSAGAWGDVSPRCAEALQTKFA